MTGLDAYRQARHLAEVGRHGDAEAKLRAALTAEPGDADLLTLLGYVLRQQRDYVAALQACDAALAANPGLADAHAERAESLIALIRDEDAIAAAGEAVRLRPHDPGGHLVLARALTSAKRYDAARHAARHGQSLAPQSVEALLTIADLERDAGNRDEAERATRAALAVEPGNAYGRWLLAMLDAERLRVRRSMRALRDVARENPARPDVISMTWPIRSLLSALRRWFSVAVLLVTAAAVAATVWGPAALPARVLAGLIAVVVAGFAVRVLVPAGRLPWRCLRLVPWLLRRATLTGAATVAVMAALLLAYAATGAWWLTMPALAGVPVLWAGGFAELLGARLDDPGYMHAVKMLGRDLQNFRVELKKWWSDTKRELREAWKEPEAPEKDPGKPPR
ncbi:tetratricopeptide repeat protein [Couchioplanes caeruleus]|uniref:tetratricopeptide repeat protein n=1 Tax=Couchioplanes caeruleus TaxID=56438 RepID=UPI0020C12F67|nr:tetratricopeptide repeat protein [Couchioplanes caeruleus]UQU61998.1 tetratricopeptide repeat protein [Couchioplanes caeruleus]